MEEKVMPGYKFNLFLFLFFYLTLRMGWREIFIRGVRLVDRAIASDIPILDILITRSLCIIMLGMTIWSIIRVLKKTQDAIICIRCAIIINIFYYLIEFLESPNQYFYGFIFLFLFLFFIYTYKSHLIKDIFPIKERRFSPGCWIWLLYTITCLIFGGFMVYFEIKKENKSKVIAVEKLNIPKGRQSDGLIMFTSDSVWCETRDTILDLSGKKQPITRWNLNLDSVKHCIFGGTSNAKRHVDFMNILLQYRPSNSMSVEEIFFCDTLINDEQYYLNQYRIRKDSVNYVWTTSFRFDSESKKYCTYQKYNKEEYAKNDLMESVLFLRDNIEFDLNQYLKNDDCNN